MARRPVQYDALIRVRQLQEDLRAQAFATAQRQVDWAKSERQALADQRVLTLQAAGERARERFDVCEIRLYYQYERRLARLMDEKDAEIVQLKGVAAERRDELEDAMKRRRMVEKLKDRKMAAYEAEVRKEEQKLVDETATNAAAMRKVVQRAARERVRVGEREGEAAIG
ncbi:MAG: hypothetical protein GWP08_09575 [Nitrospiraceae bacterium]|nr:hypothetical protein [Nitrospiraceae bacterium]